MSRLNRLPVWAAALIIGLMAAGFSLVVPWAHPGISHDVEARTYLRWSFVAALGLASIELVVRALYRVPAIRQRVEQVLIAVNNGA